MNDLTKKIQRKAQAQNNLLNYISYTGSKVGFFFMCMFTFVSGISMLINVWGNNMDKYHYIYNVRPSNNELLLKVLGIKTTEDYYNRLFIYKNALNNELNLSNEDIRSEIEKLPSLLNADGVFDSKKLQEYYKKGLSEKSLYEGMKLVILSDITNKIIDKFNNIKNNLSNQIPIGMEVSFYYLNTENSQNTEKQYKEYIIKQLIENPSGILYTSQERVGYVIEADISQKDKIKDIMNEYRANNISDDLYNYIIKNLGKHFKTHKIDNFTPIETSFISDLLFTDDREIVEIKNKIYVPITKNARSSHIKSSITKDDNKTIEERSNSKKRNDIYILKLNELLNRYNNGEINEDYLNKNLKNYTVSFKFNNPHALLSMRMLLGAKAGEAFLIGDSEAGTDISCIAIVRKVIYSEEEQTSNMIENILRSSYLTKICAIKFMQ